MIRHLKAAALTVACLALLVAVAYIGAAILAVVGAILLVALIVTLYRGFLGL